MPTKTPLLSNLPSYSAKKCGYPQNVMEK